MVLVVSGGPSLLPEGQPTTIRVLKNLLVNSAIKELTDVTEENKYSADYYIVKLNDENFKSLLSEIFYIENPEEYRRERMDEAVQKLIEVFIKQIGEIKAEIWMDDTPQIPKRIKISLNVSKPSKDDVQHSDEFQYWLSNFSLDINLVELMQPPLITSPRDFKKLEEFPSFSFYSYKSESNRRDKLRFINLYQILEAMRTYKDEHGKFPQSEKMPTSIGNLDPVPTDPGSGPCPGPYQWISNISNPQKFLIYTCFEDGKFYSIHERGGDPEEKRPTTLK